MVRRDALSEYVRASLWVLPTMSVVAALAAGALLSAVNIGAHSPLAFQGTPDDARNLLIGIAGTMVTVIALLLGLTVVALQLSSTQFSPRLLRNFLRDRPNQIVLSAFVATFAYSVAGLYTVGVSGGNRTASFPRLAVSGSLVLLFLSLGLLVFFAHHLVHSIQVDTIMNGVQRNTVTVIEDGMLTGGEALPEVPGGATVVTSRRSGYVQAVDCSDLLSTAASHGVCVRLRPRIGEHVVAGTTLAWIWPVSPGGPAPDLRRLTPALETWVRIGFERTLEQDAAFGVRQLVDTACKALSPAVNDPYTAVQAIDHLSVIFCALARRPLGDHVARQPSGAAVIVPGRRFPDYLAVMCGLIRRYGASEPTVASALLRLLAACADVADGDPELCTAIEEQAGIVVADAEREVLQPADLVQVHAAAEMVRQEVFTRRRQAD
ncbi:MAG TPA: DUF2254 domain-containing protein [Streptosporangiaceae bacterium]|nr:DUF2254 domain-containing protein [Streptosporangiaceae bacterium]